MALRVIDLGLDTTIATGKLVLNVLGSVAQFEREMMLERQREGIAKAKKEGRGQNTYTRRNQPRGLKTQPRKKNAHGDRTPMQYLREVRLAHPVNSNCMIGNV